MVVAGAAQIGVVVRQQGQVGLSQRQAFQTLAQDRFEALVAARTEAEGATAGQLQAHFAMGLAQAQDAQAGPVALGWVDAPFEDVADHAGRVRPGLLSPADQPLWRPLGVLAMALGHVLGLCAVPALVR